MAELEENIRQAIADFDDVKAAIEESGGSVPYGTETKQYGNLVRGLNRGGNSGSDGKSAYEIAISNGFEGSEVEWLESLKGEPGADGLPGQDGTPGKDGTSPVISVSSITGGHRITITDANGEKSIDVLNGSDGKPGADGSPGENGQDGHTPEKGVDYYTEADKTEMVNSVLSALPAWTGGAY